jgi:hypothetical protein
MSADSNFLLGRVAGLCIIGGLTPVRNAGGRSSAAEQDQWVVQGSLPHLGVPPEQALEVEDEFERARL